MKENTNETKHTPTPYRYEWNEGKALIYCNPKITRAPIAEVYWHGVPIKECTAEVAKFIVRACNEHAALVAVAEALKRANNQLASLVSPLQDRGCGNYAEDIRTELRNMQSALADLAAVRKGAQ